MVPEPVVEWVYVVVRTDRGQRMICPDGRVDAAVAAPVGAWVAVVNGKRNRALQVIEEWVGAGW